MTVADRAVAGDAPATPRFALSPEEIERFQRDGVIGPYRLEDLDAVEAIRHDLKRFLEDPNGAPWANITMDVHVKEPAVVDFAHRPELQDRVRSLLGEELLLWRSWTFVKAPGTGATGIHRDGRRDQTWPTVSRPVGRTPQISAWLALNEASLENGCMWVFPGTQIIDYEHEEIDRVPEVDFLMYPTHNFLNEYGGVKMKLFGRELGPVAWTVLTSLLRVFGLYQRVKSRVLLALAPRRPNDFRAPRVTGLTRDEQRELAAYAGVNVNLATVESLRRMPMKPIPLPCKPGEFWLFREDVIHTAPPNETQEFRAALVLGYAIPEVEMHADRHAVPIVPGPAPATASGHESTAEPDAARA